MKGKGIISGIVLMLSVLAIGSIGVAQATITDTFTGTVINGADIGILNGGIDTSGLFGNAGVDLTSKPFTLTLAYDPANFNQGNDLSTFTLTINGFSQTVMSQLWIFSNDDIDQQFQMSQPTPNREIDLNFIFASAQDFTKVLPTILNTGGFTLAPYNWFTDNLPNGDLNEGFGLTVTAINPPAVPIPPSALLLGSGLLGLVGLGWQRRKLSQA